MILRLAISVEHRLVTDRHTDTHTRARVDDDGIYRVRRRAVKMDRESVQNDKSHCAGHFQYSNTKVSGKGGLGLQTCSEQKRKVHHLRGPLQLTLSKLQAYGVLRPT